MKCSYCNWNNPAKATYCEECGSVIKRRGTEGANGDVSIEDVDQSSSRDDEPIASSSSSSSFKLVVMRGDNKGKEFILEEGSNLIGRWDPDSSAFPEVDLEAEDIESKISRKHAVIELKNGVASLQDIGSLNGTFVNRGSRLEQGDVVELRDGDEVIVGKTFLKFICPD